MKNLLSEQMRDHQTMVRLFSLALLRLIFVILSFVVVAFGVLIFL